MAFGISLCCCEVSEVDRLLGSDHLAKITAWRRMDRTTPARRGKRRRHIVARDDAQCAFFIEIEVAEFGFAEPHGVHQHSSEDRLQLAGRGRDDAQHLGERRTFVARLFKFALP